MYARDLLSRFRAHRRSTLLALVVIALVTVAGAGLLVVAIRDSTDAPASASPLDPGRPPAQYAVSPGGDDAADGSPARPWRTLLHALGRLGPGDRLIVHGGTYRENIDLAVHPGTRKAPVRVAAAEGERPVVVGLLWLKSPSWWDVSGLNVTWNNKNDSDQHMVKLTDGSDWRFADAELWGAKSFAALLIDGDPVRFTLSGLYVHDTHPANDTNQDHLIYLNCGTGGGVLERSILAHSANGRAVKIGPPSSGDGEVGNIVIRYVTMVDNRGPSNVQLAYDVRGVRIEHSIMVGTADGRANVTAFELHGRDDVVSESLGWDSAGLLDGGIADGGGNVRFDPRLSGAAADKPFYPGDQRAQAYGRWAPGQ